MHGARVEDDHRTFCSRKCKTKTTDTRLVRQTRNDVFQGYVAIIATAGLQLCHFLRHR